MQRRIAVPRLAEQPAAIRRYTLMIFLLLTAQAAAELLFNLYLTDLGYREDFIGVVNAVTALVWGGAAAVAGTLAHRWTARRVLIAGTLLFAAGFAARVLVLAPAAILIAFSIGCIGGGWVFAIGMVYIADATQPAQRLGAIALYTMASSLATTLGSVGGGFLPRLIAVIADTGSMAVALRVTLLMSAALMALSILPLLGAPAGGAPATTAPPSDPAAPAVTAVPHESPRQMRRDIWVYLTFVFTLAAGVAMIIPFYNVYLQRLGFSTGAIGLIYGMGGVMGTGFGLLVPAVGARVGLARGAGLLRALPGLLYIALALVSPLWLAAVAHILRRGCFDASYALESNMASQIFPPRLRAHIFAWREAVLSVGIAALSPVGGLLIVRFGYPVAFTIAALTMIAIAALMLGYFTPRERARAAPLAPRHEPAVALADS